MRFFLIPLCFLLTACFEPQAPAPVHYYYGSDGGAGVNGIHTVRQGDNLWSIANRYHLSMRDIIDANNLQAPFILHENQRLTLPPPREYTVRGGDSLYRVSLVTGIGQNAIARLNNIKSPYVIYEGQVLRLPNAYTNINTSASTNTNTKVSSDQNIAYSTPPSKPKPPPRLSVPPRTGNAKFARPVNGKVVSGFGAKAGGLHNDGVNIAAPKGTRVSAAENGVVAYSGNELKGFGNLVLVRHDGGWVSAYAHMDSISVRQGQKVSRGQKIGAVGSTGEVTSPQLHFELRKGTKALNPSKYI